MASKVSALLAEFVGTYVLVFTVGCNALSQSPAVWAPTSIACALMVMIYALGPVSGGHFNPAVSLAIGLADKFGGACSGWDMVLAYMLAQIAGGSAAGFSYCAVFHAELALGPQAPFGWWEAMVVEVLYTAMLVFVVLSVAASKRMNPGGRPSPVCALAVGCVVVAGGHGAGPISGAAFNPAVACGIDISSFGYAKGWPQCVAYTVWQVWGSIVAVLLFKLTRPEDDLSESQLAIYQPSLATKLASEFLGTFALVLSVGLNILGKSAATAWSAAATLMCMVCALGDVSGAHFNPAVTLAVVLSKKGGCSLRDGFLYVVFQLTAGVLAGVCYCGLCNKQSIALGPQAGSSDNAAYFIEFVFTFVLAFVVLATACVKGNSSPLLRSYYVALAIGSCVTA
eukprot:CAMPEP_0183417040 /NCGR_PEP_ID=MMETSP0370-20130417/24166_1 /TAXON_ID=268820 /ORGANISM="Peridinium aciculiferum, Strain PAER-2" /LENGTH=396 /DNA_ID=CAMNT_0025600591 /DNA_START=130 /DNA_END=1317 /DNA_ORIENTATION=-